MNILVCIKQVPDTTIIKIDPVTNTLMREGVPAIVRHQNTLTRECWSVWYTPAYLFQFLRFRKFDNLYERRKTHATA